MPDPEGPNGDPDPSSLPAAPPRRLNAHREAVQFNTIVSGRPPTALRAAVAQGGPPDTTFFILPILLLSGDYPLLIDQPEENLDNRLIRQVIVNILASMKLRRQVIIATHNPNLPVLGDVEQCVVLEASGRDLSSLVAIGNLDSPQIARYIVDIMEGGREAFQYRQSIYQTHWETIIADEGPSLE